MRASTLAQIETDQTIKETLLRAHVTGRELEDFLLECQDTGDASYVGGKLFEHRNPRHQARRQEAGEARYAVYYSVGSDLQYHNVVEYHPSGQPTLPALKIMGYFLLKEAATAPFIYRVGGYSTGAVPQGKISRGAPARPRRRAGS